MLWATAQHALKGISSPYRLKPISETSPLDYSPLGQREELFGR